MKQKKLKALSNIQIDQYFKNEPLYGGCYSRDDLPKQIKNQCYIVNLDSIKGPGTHWLAVLNVDPHTCYFFDSYGVINIPVEIETFMKTSNKELKCNHVDLQSINTDSCGEFCVYVCSNILNGRHFDDIINDFTLNPVINEHILFNHYGEEAFTMRTLKKSIQKHQLNGEGIKDVFNWIKNKASTVVNRVKGFVQGPRENQSPLIRSFLKDHGDTEIIAIRVCRKPIVGLTETLANIVSLGQWEKNKAEMNYSKMFHLFLLLQTKTGRCFKLEKSQNLQVGQGNWNESGCEFLPVPVGATLTPNKLFSNAEASVDNKRLYVYHPVISNCQVFCHDMLKSSHLLNHYIDQFITQDAEKVLKHLGLLEEVMAGVTNVAARADILINGQGIGKMKLFKFNK